MVDSKLPQLLLTCPSIAAKETKAGHTATDWRWCWRDARQAPPFNPIESSRQPIESQQQQQWHCSRQNGICNACSTCNCRSCCHQSSRHLLEGWTDGVGRVDRHRNTQIEKHQSIKAEIWLHRIGNHGQWDCEEPHQFGSWCQRLQQNTWQDEEVRESRSESDAHSERRHRMRRHYILMRLGPWSFEQRELSWLSFIAQFLSACFSFQTIFGPYGVNSLAPELARGKSYVEMTTIDTVTSKDIESALSVLGMTYLEAQIQGTKSQAEEGKLILLAAGDKQLFDACQTCFEAMGRNSFFVGETGNATKMNLVLQTITGVQIAGLADSIALGKLLMSMMHWNFVLTLGFFSWESWPCHRLLHGDLVTHKHAIRLDYGKGTWWVDSHRHSSFRRLHFSFISAMIDNRFSNVNLPLMHMQKDLRLAINMADTLNLPMPLTAIANEGYKNARRAGLSDSDASAICYRARH